MTATIPAQRPESDDPAAKVWAIVERAQAGDRDALGELYARYRNPVWRFIRYRVGHKELAEDLTQQVFVRMLTSLGDVRWQGRDLGAWLITVARNVVFDYFKSGWYRLAVLTDERLGDDRPNRDDDPADQVASYLTNVALLTAVKKLPVDQQECIVLRYLRGLSVAETAAAIGKSEGAVKALVYRATRALARTAGVPMEAR